MNDIDAAEEWLDSCVGQVNAEAQRGVELSRRVAALTGSAEGRGGAVRVTVGSAGRMERLDLDVGYGSCPVRGSRRRSRR
jgi:hypothetical protein